MRYVTKLTLSQDDYQNLLEALQLFIKSPKVTDDNFDEVRNLYGHLKEQYGRRETGVVDSLPKGAKAVPSTRVDWTEEKAPTKKKVVKKVIAKNGEEIETHPFVASAKQNWICTKCGKSRNSSYHKNAEGKLWLPKKS